MIALLMFLVLDTRAEEKSELSRETFMQYRTRRREVMANIKQEKQAQLRSLLMKR